MVDVSAEELDMAPPGYQKVVGDITAGSDLGIGPFELVFSSWVAEHVRDPRAFHQSILRLLRPGGFALHLFATLWSAPAVANLLLPEALSRALVERYSPRPGGVFKAYYRWCRGPSARARKRFERLGFLCWEYWGFYGHGYFDRLGPLGQLSNALASRRIWRPTPITTTYALVLLQRMP